MTDAENMAEELHALAMMAESEEERQTYMKRYAAIVNPEPEPVIEVSLNTRDCKPLTPETAAALATMFRAAYDHYKRTATRDNSRIPCPRCGQLTELRSPAGRREAWECPACGFGFDLPATE